MPELTVRALQKSDLAEWRRLWTLYLEFYKTTVPEEVYETTWKRLFTEGEFEPKGLLALKDGKPVGLTHFIYHRTCWSLVNNCYLQDLYTDAEVRGSGAGAALIAAVKADAAGKGIKNVYWMTHETNQTARKLYDRVARRTGFIEYDLM